MNALPLSYVLDEEVFVQFYYAGIFVVHYIVKVDNMISVIVHYNPWSKWFLPKNANSVLDYIYSSGVIDSI